MTAVPALRIAGLEHSFGPVDVLRGVDLTVQPGEFVALLGRSGAGKTTLFGCVTRLLEPTGGVVEVQGRRLTGARGRELARARRRIGMVFQQYNVAERLTALDNVLAGRLTHMPAWRAVLRRPGGGDRRLAWEKLALVGLADHAFQRGGTLSGGQQQRVAIARALVQQPAVLLADEPVSSLDADSAATVLTALQHAAATGIAVLCSLHQEEFAHRYASRLLRLESGRLRIADPHGPRPPVGAHARGAPPKPATTG